MRIRWSFVCVQHVTHGPSGTTSNAGLVFFLIVNEKEILFNIDSASILRDKTERMKVAVPLPRPALEPLRPDPVAGAIIWTNPTEPRGRDRKNPWHFSRMAWHGCSRSLSIRHGLAPVCVCVHSSTWCLAMHPSICRSGRSVSYRFCRLVFPSAL